MPRILGIDVGDRRVGVALSDPEGILATGIRVIDTRKSKAIEEIRKIAATHEVRVAVVGLPLNDDGSEGPSAHKARGFGSVLAERTGLDVRYVDESYSTVEAEEALAQGGVRGQKRKRIVDRLAAQIILQSYLDGAPRP